MRSVSPVIFYTGQGNIESLSATLLDGSTGAYLTGATILFTMKNDIGTVRHSIDCGEGTAAGVISIPLTETETATHGLFFGQVIVYFPGSGADNFYGSDYFSGDFFGNYFGAGAGGGVSGVQTFPSSGFLTVKIERAL